MTTLTELAKRLRDLGGPGLPDDHTLVIAADRLEAIDKAWAAAFGGEFEVTTREGAFETLRLAISGTQTKEG